MSADLLALARVAVTDHDAMQKPEELAVLLGLVVGSRPRAVWEVGSGSGGTLWALDQALALRPLFPPPALVSIDIPGGPWGTPAPVDLRAAVEGVGSRLTLIEGDSQKVELPPLQPDIVLIDGDHSYEGALADWNRYSPLVRPGGFIAFHDIVPHPPETGVEVDRLWRELVDGSSYDTVRAIRAGTRRGTSWSTVEIIQTGTSWGGIGLVYP